MATVNTMVVTVVLVQLLVCGYSSAQGNDGGCNPAPPDTLVSRPGTYSNGVPSIAANDPGK